MTREIYQSFSTLLSYPAADLAEQACTGAHAASCTPQVAETLTSFAAFVCEHGTDRMQELYTAAFDLQPLCAPYVGYQLLGEDARRGRFLMKLQELYRQNGLFPKPEMTDHLSQVLHFLATAPDSDERSALLTDGLRPAMEKMADAFPHGENPYGQLIKALRTCLETAAPDSKLCAPKEVTHA
jgi:nitrate reductase molybdenum cofactor assembly chaperone NarJ/NarW